MLRRYAARTVTPSTSTNAQDYVLRNGRGAKRRRRWSCMSVSCWLKKAVIFLDEMKSSSGPFSNVAFWFVAFSQQESCKMFPFLVGVGAAAHTTVALEFAGSAQRTWRSGLWYSVNTSRAKCFPPWSEWVPLRTRQWRCSSRGQHKGRGKRCTCRGMVWMRTCCSGMD